MRIQCTAGVIAQACREVRRIATGGCLLMLSSLAMAASPSQEESAWHTFEVTPFAGFMTGGEFEDPTDSSDRDVESDTNFGIFLNLVADVPERQYELLYTQESTVIDGNVPIDLDVQYLQIGGTVAYPQHRYVAPYFGMTVGAARFAPSEAGLNDETKISFSAGGGIRFPITKHFGIRFDVRAFITLLDSESDIFCVSNPSNTSGCLIKAKSDTFLQYTGTLGAMFAF